MNKEIIKRIFKYIGILVLILIFLFWGICKEEDKLLKRNVSSQGIKTFYYHQAEYVGKYYWGDSVSVQGAWNTTYPTNVKIDCDKTDRECLLLQASLFISTDMLDVTKESFEIVEWNEQYIKAYDEGPQYKYELNINLNNEDVTLTKHPLSKNGVFGNKLETSTFQLYDGWKVDMNINRHKVKNAKWWQVPLLKTLNILFPLKDDRKIDLL